MPQSKIEDIYKTQCQYFNIFIPTCSLQKHPTDTFTIDCKYCSIFDILTLQLGKLSIYRCLTFVNVRDQDTDIIVWPSLLKIKLNRDGFTYRNGRTNILSTLSNCSLKNCENSRNTCSIVSLGDFDENRYNLSLFSQRQDIETFHLRVFGLPDPNTGVLCGFYISNVEDSASLAKSLGRDSARSKDGRFLWSQFGRKYHQIEWEKWHVCNR